MPSDERGDHERGDRYLWKDGDFQIVEPTGKEPWYEKSQQMHKAVLAGLNEKPAEDVKRALATWERKALNRLKDGRSAHCPFETPDIDPQMMAIVRGGLLTAETVEDVRDVFHQALAAPAYLPPAPAAEAPAPEDRAAILARWRQRRLDHETLHGPAETPAEEE